jgi:hypothetical protein
MMKRILACFLSVLMLAALLTACGSKSTATSAAASAAASAATSAATSAAASAATSAPSGDATLAFVFKNKTGLTMTGAYVYPAGCQPTRAATSSPATLRTTPTSPCTAGWS